MGTSTPLGFAAKMHAAAAVSPRAAKAGTEAAALITKRSISAIAPARLRGVGKRGAKLGVRYTVGEYPDGAKALIFATGPWQLIERDTQEHRIPRARGVRARKRFVVIPDAIQGPKNGPGGVRAFANHPGTKGKHPFERGTVVAEPLRSRAYAGALHAEYLAIFH